MLKKIQMMASNAESKVVEKTKKMESTIAKSPVRKPLRRPLLKTISEKEDDSDSFQNELYNLEKAFESRLDCSELEDISVLLEEELVEEEIKPVKGEAARAGVPGFSATGPRPKRVAFACAEPQLSEEKVIKETLV